MPEGENSRVLTISTMNPFTVAMEYAVRGPIPQRANEIELELASGAQYPFAKVTRANIGDCHATGQVPITFIRQVAALCAYPPLFNETIFPSDAKLRARRILDCARGRSIGSYTDSPGLSVVRQDVSDYIQQRDGYPCDFTDVFLCTGASDGIKSILSLLMTGKIGTERAGIMIPIPQYPLYSATLTEYNAYQISYYLDEFNNWSLDVAELNRALTEARSHCKPRAICVINPGNPTGQVLTRLNIEKVIRFAKQEKLVILADEVYQHNIYDPKSEFHSFKKVLMDLGPEFANQELASFMSASKGYMGECGYRAGYCEMVNFDPEVKAQLMKMISAKLCPPVPGQVVVDVVANPPTPSEPSYALFQKEKAFVLNMLKQKAQMVTKTFNSIEGVQCNTLQGAMYAFPCIALPLSAQKAAEDRKMKPDVFYCKELLEQTGICVVPGSGFGQRPGTFHFRITILPPIEEMVVVMEQFKEFHLKFLQGNYFTSI